MDSLMMLRCPNHEQRMSAFGQVCICVFQECQDFFKYRFWAFVKFIPKLFLILLVAIVMKFSITSLIGY